MGKIINITDKIKENQRKFKIEEVKKRLYDIASRQKEIKSPNDSIQITWEEVTFIMDQVVNPIDIKMVSKFILDNISFYSDVSRFAYIKLNKFSNQLDATLWFTMTRYIRECAKNNSKILFGALELDKDIKDYTDKEFETLVVDGINFVSEYLDELDEEDLNNE